ncbi:MAG: response regulator [Candidatus Dormiibacterota bacterium]
MRDTLPLVVLVEDDPAIGEMYRLGLEKAGFRVAVFQDAGAFFCSAEDEIPAAAVLDFQLGGVITGIDVLENLRLYDSMVRLPVIVLSNCDGRDDGQIERATQAGALAWLVKSRTTPLRLAELVRQALGSPVLNVSAPPNGATARHSEADRSRRSKFGRRQGEPAAQSG